ncbi:MAG TPA: hypothetical protein EYO58_06025 [Flavobacteriales bacterium]|nr:hypothetical protein [Flavobacteriales bacterium]
MKNYFLKSSRWAKRNGDSHERIQRLQQLSDRKTWDVKDLNQFGQLLPLKAFRAEYDLAIYTLHEDTIDIMLYPQMYYIQLLKEEGRWYYKSLSSGEEFAHPDIEYVEQFVFNEIKDSEKNST